MAEYRLYTAGRVSAYLTLKQSSQRAVLAVLVALCVGDLGAGRGVKTEMKG